MSDTQMIYNNIKKSVESISPGAKIILYGSYARGDYHDESDIDVLILVNQENINYKEEQKIAYQLYDLELATGRVITPLIMPEKKWYEFYPNTALYKNINMEGKLL